MTNNQPITNNQCPVRKCPWGAPITDHLSDDLLFLITCCQTDLSKDDIEFIRSYLDAQHLDLHILIGLANQHGILPLVYKTLLALNADTPVVKTKEGCKKLSDKNSNLSTNHGTLLAGLKSTYTQIAQRNMLMSAELIRIMKLFKENSIEALAFKGPTLSQTAYGDITLRQFGDLDILIKRSDISPMIDLLIANGYAPEIELNTKMKDTFLNALNVIGFYKSSSNILIEIHWELLSKNYAINWDENALWRQKRESTTINNNSIQMLPHEEQLLYLCTHGSKHLFERLEWVCDIDRSIKVNSNINWRYLLNTAEKRGIKRMLYLGLALCQHFFRLELPELIQENIKQDRVLPGLISKIIEMNFSKVSQKGKSYSTFGLLWNMRENLSDQLRFSWHGLFAPKFDDFKFIQLPKYLAFLYPILRPFRLVAKYFKH